LEIWSDEVIAAYQKNLKMSPLVKKISMTGKKGDTIHVPKPIRGAASAKAESTAVTIQANLESELQIAVDRHFEYSRFIEDIVETQALNSLRQFYTEDAGYQLALKVDTDLMNAATGFGDGTKTFAPANTGADWVASNSYYSNAGSALAAYAADTVATGDNFSDVVFRALIKLMDDADVPMENRALIVPPAARSTIMGIDRYVSSDFVGGRGVESGLIGNLYGVDVYVSSNCPVIEAAAQNSASSLDTRGCLFFHKDAVVHAEQMAVRSQTQYKQEYLSTLYTADTLYGVEVYRPEAGFVLAIADE
jgi:N4-gp56 family major capsid protein